MDLVLTFLSGGLFIKFLELGSQSLRDHLARRKAETTFIDDHLGPLLKEADEVCGKLRAEADRDFIGLKTSNGNNGPIPVETIGFEYLIARFWGRIEIFRRASLNAVIGRNHRGKKTPAIIKLYGVAASKVSSTLGSTRYW